MEKIIRKVEIWKKVEERRFPTATQQKNFFFKIKKESNRENTKVKMITLNLGKRDTTLTGIEKEISKYQEESPKPSRKERLKKFKEKRTTKERKR